MDQMKPPGSQPLDPWIHRDQLPQKSFVEKVKARALAILIGAGVIAAPIVIVTKKIRAKKKKR
jgi:hypothetical protein